MTVMTAQFRMQDNAYRVDVLLVTRYCYGRGLSSTFIRLSSELQEDFVV